MKELKETRVGYATIDALCGLCLDYVGAHTVQVGDRKRYVGDLKYLVLYDQMRLYLSGLSLKPSRGDRNGL